MKALDVFIATRVVDRTRTSQQSSSSQAQTQDVIVVTVLQRKVRVDVRYRTGTAGLRNCQMTDEEIEYEEI